MKAALKSGRFENAFFQIVLKGKARYRVGGEDKVLGPGDVALMPADVEHEIEILEDIELINVKDVVEGWSVKEAKWENSGFKAADPLWL